MASPRRTSNFLANRHLSSDASTCMKLLAIAFLLLGSLAASAEDMQAYLRQTQSLVQRGQHKEALERMIWFHENALRQDPSIYTTRLTVALDSWKRLADFYDPAQQALIAIRDRNEARLLGRGGSRQLFHDFVAINGILGEPSHSLTVFRKLHNDDPKLARQYWPLVRDVVLEERELQLASNYITDVKAEFETIRKTHQRLSKNSSKRPGAQSEIVRAREERFVGEIRPLLELAVINGDPESAIEMQADALELIDDPALQRELTEGLPKIPAALPPAEDPLILEE